MADHLDDSFPQNYRMMSHPVADHLGGGPLVGNAPMVVTTLT